jgi:hypothetical protein
VLGLPGPTLRAAPIKITGLIAQAGGHGRAPTVFWGSKDCQGRAEFSLWSILPKPCAFWVSGADPVGTDAMRSKTGMRIDLVIQSGHCYWEHDLKKIVLKVILPIDTGPANG